LTALINNFFPLGQTGRHHKHIGAEH